MASAAMSPLSDTDVKAEHKPTLTPPASEEADKRYDSESELSELDLEPEEKLDDDGEIEPDHYYEGGKIPVFKPVCYLLCPALPLHGSSRRTLILLYSSQW